MMLQSFRIGFLPFSDVFCGFVASLYNSTTAIHHIPTSTYYGGQFIIDDGVSNNEADAKSVDVDVGDLDPLEWHLWWFDYSLDAGSNVHAGDLVLSCVREGGSAPTSCFQESHPKKQRRRKLVAWNEQFVTFAVVVATLQLFLHLTRANATALPLPMLSRAGGAALALVNAAGVLGSALATRRYGREATCAVSAALIVFCQIGVPALVGAHAGLSGGTRSTTPWHAAVACAVSCGLGWAWGALFWAFPGPGEGIRSAGPAALGFVQMHCSLLTLRRLRHAALAYYAARIWS